MSETEIVALLLDETMPAARLGELLRAARKRRGWKRKKAAAHVQISAHVLRLYERGGAPIPHAVCARLADAYGEDLSEHVPLRIAPRVTGAALTVGSERRPIADTTIDAIVATYAEILQRVRKLKPGEAVPLRAADLAALSAALEADPDTLEERIMHALGCSLDEARSLHRELLRRRLVLPVAGLAAGVVALAGVQAAHASGNDATPAPAVAVAHGPVVAPPTTRITVAPTTAPTTTTTSTPPVVIAPPPVAPLPARHITPPPVTDPAPANVTPPSIDPHDNTPVSVLPGETPITTDISTAISTVEDNH